MRRKDPLGSRFKNPDPALVVLVEILQVDDAVLGSSELQEVGRCISYHAVSIIQDDCD